MLNTPDNIDLSNMMIFLQCLSLFVLLIIIVLLFALVKALSKRAPTVDDPTGEIKQKIFNTLTKVKEDLDTTV